MAINTWPSSPASNSHRGASFVETVLLNVPCATKSLPLHQSVSWMGLCHTPLSLQTLALESASEMALHHKRVLIAVSKVKIMLQWANNSTFFARAALPWGSDSVPSIWGSCCNRGLCHTHGAAADLTSQNLWHVQLILSARLPCATKVQVETRILKQCAPEFPL